MQSIDAKRVIHLITVFLIFMASVTSTVCISRVNSNFRRKRDSVHHAIAITEHLVNNIMENYGVQRSFAKVKDYYVDEIFYALSSLRPEGYSYEYDPSDDENRKDLTGTLVKVFSELAEMKLNVILNVKNETCKKSIQSEYSRIVDTVLNHTLIIGYDCLQSYIVGIHDSIQIIKADLKNLFSDVLLIHDMISNCTENNPSYMEEVSSELLPDVLNIVRTVTNICENIKECSPVRVTRDLLSLIIRKIDEKKHVFLKGNSDYKQLFDFFTEDDVYEIRKNFSELDTNFGLTMTSKTAMSADNFKDLITYFSELWSKSKVVLYPLEPPNMQRLASCVKDNAKKSFTAEYFFLQRIQQAKSAIRAAYKTMLTFGVITNPLKVGAGCFVFRNVKMAFEELGIYMNSTLLQTIFS